MNGNSKLIFATKIDRYHNQARYYKNSFLSKNNLKPPLWCGLFDLRYNCIRLGKLCLVEEGRSSS